MPRFAETLRGRPAWQLWGGGAAVIVLIGFIFWFMANGPGARLISPAGSTVVEYTGTGDTATPTFEVRDGWKIRWSVSGTRLTIAVRGDRNLGTVVSVEESRTGVTSPPAGGRYHLEVTAAGPWTITILQGD